MSSFSREHLHLVGVFDFLLRPEQAQQESGLALFSKFLLKVSGSLARNMPIVLASHLIFGSVFVLVGSKPRQLIRK